ncbi:MAG: type II toxin-antitoxin system VapC family toxin, partial [Spirochaetaceae bacterium]|nr:type II toxin-antitoxin system VapC family toxin [Spirochaetaceae bacterium]
MMVIDTSALAILEEEPTRRLFNRVIEAATATCVSAASLLETRIVLCPFERGRRPCAGRLPAVWSGLAALVAAFRGQPEEGVLRRILSGVPDGSELELQVLSYIVRTYELEPTVLETAARAGEAPTLGGADVNRRGSRGNCAVGVSVGRFGSEGR